MKKQLLTLMLLSSLSGVASASDFDWTGGYVGLTAASHSGESDSATVVSGSWSIESQALQNEVATRSASQLDPDGTGFGIQGGYDYQFANNWVWGISAEYSKISADDSRSTGPLPSTAVPTLSYTYGNAIEVDDSWAVRTRLGYAFGRSLVYLSAGWISVDVDAAASLLSNGGYNKLGVINEDLDAIGWGLGWEYAFNDNWSMQLEYQRADFDDFQFANAYVPGSSFAPPTFNYIETHNQDLEMSSIRLGVNYRF